MSDVMAGTLTRARRGQSDAGSRELVEGPPGAGLGGPVRGYVGFGETSPSPLRRREAPSGTAVVVVDFGARIEVGAGGPTVVHAESSERSRS